MNKATEILNNVKELLNISKEVDLSKEVEVEEKVVEAVLAEEPKEAEPAPEVAPANNYATAEELSAVKAELLSMIKALIEDKPMGNESEVPKELSKEKEVELSEKVEEVVHSPENEVEAKRSLLSGLNKPMTVEERVNKMLFN